MNSELRVASCEIKHGVGRSAWCVVRKLHAAIRSPHSTILLIVALILSACWQPSFPEISGLTDKLGGLQQFAEDLGLGDLTDLVDLNDLAKLPDVTTPPGAINYNGITQFTIAVGERIPGTDMQLSAIGAQGADFEIAGLRRVSNLGDSLDYSGVWPQLPDVTYDLRLRIIYIGGSSVRAAGWHRLIIPNIAAQVAPAGMTLGGYSMKFPFLVNVPLNQPINGTTLGYGGSDTRGGIITGLPAGEYNFRKVGDSINWLGLVRNDIAAQYTVRMITFTDSGAEIGGTVTVALPTN